jgi:membrane-bound serine protease (ClpP class)
MYRRLLLLACLALLPLSPRPAAQTEAVAKGAVYIIPVNEEISPFLSVYLKRSFLKAEADEASHIIFELNTFGGRVDSALEIAALIASEKRARPLA